MDRTVPINEEGVDTVLAAVSSPITQNLLRVAVAAARMRFIRQVGQPEEEWRSQLPVSAFDMGFFARVLADAFANERALRDILNGASIEEATEWKL